MNVTWIHFLGDPLPAGASAEPAQLLGGKGASLDGMTRAGLPVPPGFTIFTGACRWFFEHGETWPPELADELRDAMVRLEQLTGKKSGSDSAPLLVAVRSGAAVSMPGMMDTVLNVGVSADAWGELVGAINQVLRSWNSERAVAWRSRHPSPAADATAVTVQVMVPASASGVVFTRNPAQLLAPHLAIEAVSGLGAALVAGEVTPERFVVLRDNFTGFIGRPPRPEAALTPGEIAQLCRLALRVEDHFGAPQDIEWALADGRFALLQARPIRGWTEACQIEKTRLGIVTRLRQLAGRSKRVWIAHNLGETLEFPTPATWSVVRRYMSGDGGFGRMYRRLGYQPSAEVCRDGFLELIGGRIYADPDRLARLFWDGLPLSYDLTQLKCDPAALQRPPTRLDPDRADDRLLFRLPGAVRSLWRGARELSARRRDAMRRFEHEVLPPFLDWVRARRADDLAALSTAQLVEELDRRRARVLDDFAAAALLPAFLAGLATADLEKILAQLMGPKLAAQTVQELTTALPGEIGAEQETLLERVARGEATLSVFLNQFGHRAAGEMELMTPRWREESGEIESLVAGLQSKTGAWPSARRADAAKRRESAEHRLPALLAEWSGSSMREEVQSLLRETRALLPYRERGRHFLMAGYELIRRVWVELGRRWDLGDGVFFLEVDELPRFEPEREKLQPLIELRREERGFNRHIELPEVIDSTQLHHLGQSPPPILQAGDWQGSALASGRGEGRVVVARGAHEAEGFESGGVLVCPSTDPGWMPLLVRACALVVERGGLLSHGAVVARDLGLPAVVLPGATELLRTGEMVHVDGDTGRIARVRGEERHD